MVLHIEVSSPINELEAFRWTQVLMLAACVIALFVLIKSLHSNMSSDLESERYRGRRDDDHITLIWAVIGIFAVGITYLSAMQGINYFMSAPVLMIVYMAMIGVRRPRAFPTASATAWGITVLAVVWISLTPPFQGTGFFTPSTEMVSAVPDGGPND